MISNEDLKNEAKSIQDELVSIRRHLHQFPEAGVELPNTKSFVKNKLIEYGFTNIKEIDGGIVTEISNTSSTNCILLRADMDALNVLEKTKLPFASKNSCMHACGHDMHTTMLLGACKLLMKHKDEINGTIKILFQVDEEGFTGAKRAISSKVLENPKVDAAIALHVHSGTKTAMVLYSKGNMMSSCTLFEIKVKGKGCHGAMPETGIDPINIGAHIHLALQELNAREVQAQRPLVITIGEFNAGKAPNVIPETCTLKGSIRTFDDELTKEVIARIDAISKGIAKSFKGEAKTSIIASAPTLYNDPELTEYFSNKLRNVFGPDTVYDISKGGMGSEDFASFSRMVKSTYFLLGAGSCSENPLYGKPMHNECVVFNEDILSKGSFMFTYLALQYLNDKK